MWGTGSYGKVLSLPLNFAVNLQLLLKKKIKSFKKIKSKLKQRLTFDFHILLTKHTCIL